MDTADFTGATLSIGDVASTPAGAGAFTMTFTDSAFSGLTLAKISDTFPTPITSSLVGNKITLSFAGFSSGSFSGNASFTLLPAAATAVPEPGPLALGGIAGLAGFLAWARRGHGAG